MEKTETPGVDKFDSGSAIEDVSRQPALFAHDGAGGKHTDGTIQLINAKNQVRLIPTASKSPKDPLNFSRARRIGVFICVVWFAIMALSIVGGFGALAPYFFGLYIPQGVDPDRIARLLTWPSLFTGVANFAFMPAALVIGRRPVFIFAACLLLASSLWAANAGTSFESHLSARIVQGVAAGATESLLPLIITDMTFVHERAWYFGAYWVLQSIFTAILNLCSSFIAINLAWTWYYYIFSIMAGAGLILVIFLAPETKFARPAFAIDGQIMRIDEYGNMVAVDADEDDARLDHEEDWADDQPTSYWRTLKPLEPAAIDKHALKTLANCFLYMGYSLLDPAILWALGAASLALGVNIAISLSFGNVLEKAYHWPSQNTGLIYLGAIPACIFAFVCAGWGGDKINLALARRNKGLHLPEHRLPALIFPVITGLAVVIMYGYCAQTAPKTSWFSIVFGMNYATYYFVCVLIVVSTYTVEALPHHAGPAIVCTTGLKNICAFGLSTAVVPASNAGKYVQLSWIFFGASAGWFLLGIPLYFSMGRFREWRSAKKL